MKLLQFLPRRFHPVMAVLLGIPLGSALFTFRYAEGLSYFSSDPRACVNCHIMQEQYDSWAKSGHHHVAGCVDCHLPHPLVPKLLAKSRHGWNHSVAFTLQNFHEPIRIGARSAAEVQENCLACHRDFVHDVVAMQSPAEQPGESVSCVHCHKGVGHAPTRPTKTMSWLEQKP